MTLNYINLLTLLSEREGFGINTDIFETNILNLSVVIGFLFYYGKSVLTDIVKSRKETILKNIQDAENKFREAEEKLLLAKNNLDNAKLKADQIRTQSSILSSETAKNILKSIEEDIKRLKMSNLSTIRLEEERSINEVCQKLSELALNKAVEKLEKKLNSNIQKKIITQNIDKLSSKYITSTK